MSSIVRDISIFFADLNSVISLSYIFILLTVFVLITFVIFLIRSQKAEKSRARQLDDVLFRLKNAVEDTQKDSKALRTAFLSTTSLLEELVTSNKAISDDMIAIQRTILDVASVQEGGGKITDAIDLAKSGFEDEKIAKQTGLPLETVKAISLFHTR